MFNAVKAPVLFSTKIHMFKMNVRWTDLKCSFWFPLHHRGVCQKSTTLIYPSVDRLVNKDIMIDSYLARQTRTTCLTWQNCQCEYFNWHFKNCSRKCTCDLKTMKNLIISVVKVFSARWLIYVDWTLLKLITYSSLQGHECTSINQVLFLGDSLRWSTITALRCSV